MFSQAGGQPPIDLDETLAWLDTYGAPLISTSVTPAGCCARRSAPAKAFFSSWEAQLGALRDIDYGIYPFSSSSSPLASYAPIGGGLPSIKVEEVVGVVKAYSTCVGEGPFVGELSGDMARALRARPAASTARPPARPCRVAWMDVVATCHGIELQGATTIALTKLDILAGFDEIPVCVGYRLRGEILRDFPYTPELYACEPVYKTLAGWKRDISSVRAFSDLPAAAQEYVLLFLEKELGCPIKYVSVGAEREQIILR